MSNPKQSGNQNSGITVVATETAWQDSWLSMNVSRFIDRNGEPQSWSYVSRRNERKAVVVLARNQADELIIIKQFRIPFQQWVYEFPAGLVDEGEDLASAANRELLEETGYTAKILSVSPELASTAGLATETFNLVHGSIEVPIGTHEREGAEAIEVIHIPRGSEADFIAKARSENIIIDGKLYTYLLSCVIFQTSGSS